MSANNTNFIIFALQSYGSPSPPTGGYGVHGRLTEWLGSGLQNRLRRFESATDLNQSLSTQCQGFFVFNRSQLAELRIENKKDLKAAKRPRDWLKGSPHTESLRITHHRPQIKQQTRWYSADFVFIGGLFDDTIFLNSVKNLFNSANFDKWTNYYKLFLHNSLVKIYSNMYSLSLQFYSNIKINNSNFLNF